MSFIRNFQNSNGLIGDGIIGPKTLYKAKEVYCIDTDSQVAHLFGQCHHESAGFTALEENLNYSAEALLRVFGKYFDAETAQSYARQPEKIANRVYANRMGNGDEASGEGWKYRGRGVIQLTGKNNYQAFSAADGQDYINNPDAVKDLFFEPAIHFFDTNHIWDIARDMTTDSIRQVTRKINGGYHGLDDRIRQTQRYFGMMG